MEKKPAARNGRHITPQTIQLDAGRAPSIMCMASAQGHIEVAAAEDLLALDVNVLHGLFVVVHNLLSPFV